MKTYLPINHHSRFMLSNGISLPFTLGSLTRRWKTINGEICRWQMYVMHNTHTHFKFIWSRHYGHPFSIIYINCIRWFRRWFVGVWYHNHSHKHTHAHSLLCTLNTSKYICFTVISFQNMKVLQLKTQNNILL